MPRPAGLLAVLVVACMLWGCNGKPAIAVLKKADGPTDKQEGSRDAAWKSAAVGAKFFIGDAVRTGDAGAELELAGTAKITMQSHTILRFGQGKGNSTKLAVELGAIKLQVQQAG